MKQVKELMGFLSTTKIQLSSSIQKAKQRAGIRGPWHRITVTPTTATSTTITIQQAIGAASKRPQPKNRNPSCRHPPSPCNEHHNMDSLPSRTSVAAISALEDGSAFLLPTDNVDPPVPSLLSGVDHQPIEEGRQETIMVGV
jgi:hypothetical protein